MISTELFDKTRKSWEKIKNEVISLEQEAFKENSFTNEEIEADFLNKDNIVVLLKNNVKNEDKVIGFTYAKPFEPETDDGPAKPGETSWMWDTVIEKEHRGKGLLGKLMSTTEDELKNRGFKYLERNAVISNKFAENISKYYKDRIIKSFSLDSIWVPQIFFRIKL